MTEIRSNLAGALRNLHISIPLALSILLELAPIWIPSIKGQCQETQKVLMLYGIAAAANSGPTSKQ
jgi:hypothetical protein